MADERDPLVSRRYRELGSEEPPAELDERILARSRRRRSFQWHGPVAAAAVIVLAVAVTVHLERDQRTSESIPASAPPEAAPAAKEDARVQERRYAPDPPVAQKAEPVTKAAPAPAPEATARSRARSESRAGPSAEEQKRETARDAAASQPVPQAPRAAEVSPPLAANATREDQRERAEPPKVSAGSRVAKLAEQSPEQWLQGIAELRAQGKHEEADESLKRFRERYPEYQIPEETKAKIERK